MPRFDPKTDPTRYEVATFFNDALTAELRGQPCIARLCPFCDQKVELLYPGRHSASRGKCPNCGEQVAFPAVTFSKVKPPEDTYQLTV